MSDGEQSLKIKRAPDGTFTAVPASSWSTPEVEHGEVVRGGDVLTLPPHNQLPYAKQIIQRMIYQGLCIESVSKKPSTYYSQNHAILGGKSYPLTSMCVAGALLNCVRYIWGKIDIWDLIILSLNGSQIFGPKFRKKGGNL